MHRIYLTLQANGFIDELLRGDVDAITKPFRPLLDPSAVAWLAYNGGATFNSYQAHMRRHGGRLGRNGKDLAELPFVPHLGALRLNAKAQVEHRAFYHDRGHTTWFADASSASPTGLRLVPRQDELASAHQLEDTYDSPQDQALSQRIYIEGSTDVLISEDESTWHVAFSVEPRQRIVIRPQSAEAAAAIEHFRVAARVYVHVYPYGAMTATLGLSVLADGDRPTAEFIALLRLLTGRRAAPAFEFAMRGVESAPASRFLGDLLNRTDCAITGRAEAIEHVHFDYALSISATTDELSDAELSGLLTLDDRYEIFKDDWREARASLYGKYAGDRVFASRTTMAVATSPEHFAPGPRRRFFWRCHAIKELADLQQTTLWRAAGLLTRAGTNGGPVEAEVTRAMAVAEHLIEFPRGLPAHHRKWFYECQNLMSSQKTIDDYYAALAGLHQRAQQQAMIRRMEEQPRVQIDVTNSQIGTLNLGTIIGDVQNHLAAVTDADEVRDGLAQLAQAIVDSDELEDEQRRELLEHVDLLAEEAARPPEKRRPAVIRPVLAALGAGTAVAANLAALWSTLGPVLAGFFGG
jgi:hypothetical protein